MSRLRTRRQLMDRLRATTNRPATGDDPRIRRFIDESWADIWAEMVGASSGFGLLRHEFTATADQETYDLPAVFSSLRHLVLNPGDNKVLPARVTDRQVADMRTPAAGHYYQLEGPGQEFDGGQNLVQYPQRLRFYGPLTGGTVVRIVMIGQPQSLANADGTYADPDPNAPAPLEDDSITVDLLAPEVETFLIATAAMRGATREDIQSYQRHFQATQLAFERYMQARTRGDAHSPRSPESYISVPARGAGYR